MVALRDCLATVREASGDVLSEQEALDLLEQVQRRRTRLEASGQIDRIEQRLREAAQEDAARAQVVAALQRKHAVLGALRRRQAQDAVEAHIAAGLSYRQAVLAVLEGTSRATAGARHSVAATILAYEARYVGGLMGRIAQERPGLERRLRDEKLMADATRLMFKEPVENPDPDARYLADLLAEYAELSRIDLNQLGANIGKLDGWVPQGHMDWRLRQIDKDDWVRFIRPLLDVERTFPDTDDVDRVLGEIYDNITLGRDIDAPRPEGAFKGPANLARTLERHRVLHFANADAYMAYNQQFGFGNLFSSMESHLRKAARSAAMMDMLGPNPGHTLDSLLDSLIAQARRDEGLKPDKRRSTIKSLERGQSNVEGGRSGTIGSAYGIVSGLSSTPDHWGLAQAASTFRAVQSMSKLGSAVITAVTDLGSLVVNLNYQGKSYGSALARTFEEMIAGRGKGEQRAIAYLLGEGFDGIIGHMVSRYGATDTMPGRMSRLMTHFFRWNGLSSWTDAARSTAARIMSADMGRMANLDWDALPPKYRRVLTVHDINPERWDAIRATAWKAENGRTYVTPDRIENRDTAIALHRFYADEATYGVIEVDESTRRFSTFGTNPGTVAGEVVRMVMQFKGFPVAFTKRVLGRAIFGTSGTERGLHVAKLIATLTVAGYISQMGKDFLRGRDPKDLDKPETWVQALLQSGAAGVYGDFLFNMGASRFGNTALETAAGPVATTLADLVNLYQGAIAGETTQKELFDSIWQNVPGQNIWWVRTAMDVLFLNELREAMSPGYLRRQRRYAKEEYGQEILLPQSAWR